MSLRGNYNSKVWIYFITLFQRGWIPTATCAGTTRRGATTSPRGGEAAKVTMKQLSVIIVIYVVANDVIKVRLSLPYQLPLKSIGPNCRTWLHRVQRREEEPRLLHLPRAAGVPGRGRRWSGRRRTSRRVQRGQRRPPLRGRRGAKWRHNFLKPK